MKNTLSRRSPVRQSGPMDDRFNEIQERWFPGSKIPNIKLVLGEYLKYYKSLPYEIWSKTKEFYLIMAYVFDESPKDNTSFLALINLDPSTDGRELFLKTILDMFYSDSLSGNIESGSFPIGYRNLYLLSEKYLTVPGMHNNFIEALQRKIKEIRRKIQYEKDEERLKPIRAEEQRRREEEQRVQDEQRRLEDVRKKQWKEEQRLIWLEWEQRKKREMVGKGVGRYISDASCPITYSFSSNIEPVSNDMIAVECPLGKTNLSFFGLFHGRRGNGISIHAAKNIPEFFLGNIGDTPYEPITKLPQAIYDEKGNVTGYTKSGLKAIPALEKAHKPEMQSIKELAIRGESSTAMCVIDNERKTIYSAIMGNSEILLIRKPKEGVKEVEHYNLSFRSEYDKSTGLGSRFKNDSGPTVEEVKYEPGDTLIIGNRDSWEPHYTSRGWTKPVNNGFTLIDSNYALANFVHKERIVDEKPPFLLAASLINNIKTFDKNLNPTLLVVYLGDVPTPTQNESEEARTRERAVREAQEALDAYEEQVRERAVREEQAKPVLTKVDYYTVPEYSQLRKMSLTDLERVKLTVGRQGFGKVEFENPVDLRSVNLDECIEFEKGIVYVDRSKTCKGKFSGPAIVTLKIDVPDQKKTKRSAEKIQEFIKQKTVDMSAEFISFDIETGIWKFRVQSFKRSSGPSDSSRLQTIEDMVPEFQGGDELAKFLE